MTDRKDPLPQVLLLAASLTYAKNAIRTNYGGMGSNIALGYATYAIADFEAARQALKDDGAEFGNIIPDECKGLIASSLNTLRHNAVALDNCVADSALKDLAKAHRLLERFHKAVGYRGITDDDIANGPQPGVGGGR